jgi:large subunit ribosomal protein L24
VGKGLHVTKNDVVEVIAGNHAGKRGRVLQAMPKTGKVIVEGVNYVWKHVRPSRRHQRGGRIQIEAPIDASNVLVVCPNRDCARHDHGVRTRSINLEDGSRARGCVKCGGVVPRNTE